MKFNADGVSSTDIHSINEEAMLYFRQAYAQSEEARAYLRERGVSKEAFHKFKIGYAPGDMALIKTMAPKIPGQDVTQHRFKKDGAGVIVEYDLNRIKQLNAAGLINWYQNRIYDKFYDRMMFPIRDKDGLVVGFGGRIFKKENQKKDNPKYMNTPETIVFSKRNHLYGLYESLQSLAENNSPYKRFDRIYVFEGFMDVIQAHQNGLTNSTASLGTAVTDEQISLLMEYTNAIVFVFDGDAAGERASSRALSVAAPFVAHGKDISFAFLPEGEDPDSMIKNKGVKVFEATVSEHSRSFIEGVILEGMDHYMGPVDGGAGLSAQRYLYSVNILKKMFTSGKDADYDLNHIYKALSVLNLFHELDPEFMPEQLIGFFKHHCDEGDYLPEGDIPSVTRSSRMNSTSLTVDFN